MKPWRPNYRIVVSKTKTVYLGGGFLTRVEIEKLNLDEVNKELAHISSSQIEKCYPEAKELIHNYKQILCMWINKLCSQGRFEEKTNKKTFTVPRQHISATSNTARRAEATRQRTVRETIEKARRAEHESQRIADIASEDKRLRVLAERKIPPVEIDDSPIIPLLQTTENKFLRQQRKVTKLTTSNWGCNWGTKDFAKSGKGPTYQQEFHCSVPVEERSYYGIDLVKKALRDIWIEGRGESWKIQVFNKTWAHIDDISVRELKLARRLY